MATAKLESVVLSDSDGNSLAPFTSVSNVQNDDGTLTLKARLAAIEADMAGMEETIGDSTTGLCKDMDDAEATLESLTAQMEEYKASDVEAAMADIDALEGKATALESSMAALESRIDALESTVSTLQAEVSTLTAKAADIYSKSETYTKAEVEAYVTEAIADAV